MRTKKKLTKTELKKFKKTFEQKLASLEAAVDKFDCEVDADGDEVDAIQGAVISGVAEKLSQRDIQMIQKLYIALEKIENGTFGLCESCEEFISPKRLIALPGCSMCIHCAEIEEKDSKQYI